MSRFGCTIFVGNLPGDVREREVEDLFYKYGRIAGIDLKTPPRPPAFAFVEFNDPRDAEDAVAGRDNYDFHGNRLRVEISHGRARERGGFGAGGGGHERGGRSGYVGPQDILEKSRNKGTAYRAIVKGLPASASWQDLKDHFRKVVKPSYTNVVRDRGSAMGIVEFETADDLDRAIDKLDDTEFRNPFDRGFIRVIEDDAGRGRGRRSRSRSRNRGRSYSRTPSSRSRSAASRSRSKTPAGSRSASRSRSKSRSRSSRSASPMVNGEEPAGDGAPRHTSRSPSA